MAKKKGKVYIICSYVKADSIEEALSKRGKIISCTEVTENPKITELVSAIGSEYNKEPWSDFEEVVPETEMGFTTKHMPRPRNLSPRKHDLRKVPRGKRVVRR